MRTYPCLGTRKCHCEARAEGEYKQKKERKRERGGGGGGGAGEEEGKKKMKVARGAATTIKGKSGRARGAVSSAKLQRFGEP